MRRIASVLSVALLSLAVGARAQCDTPANFQTGTFTFAVPTVAAGAGVAGALITIHNPAGNGPITYSFLLDSQPNVNNCPHPYAYIGNCSDLQITAPSDALPCGKMNCNGYYFATLLNGGDSSEEVVVPTGAHMRVVITYAPVLAAVLNSAVQVEALWMTNPPSLGAPTAYDEQQLVRDACR